MNETPPCKHGYTPSAPPGPGYVAYPCTACQMDQRLALLTEQNMVLNRIAVALQPHGVPRRQDRSLRDRAAQGLHRLASRLEGRWSDQ